jgi:hypothetical protein
MKLVLIACVILITASTAEAAPREIEDLCWARAQAAPLRFNGRGEREAFIANCIADNTPPIVAKQLRNKKYRY